MFVDLSVPLNNQTPVYPGDLPAKVQLVSLLERDGFTDHLISTGNHAGTHIDAPMHMIANGKSLNDFDVSHFVGRGRLVKVENGAFDLKAVQQADIKAGDIVLFHTGMSNYYHEPIYYKDYPAMPAEVAKYLVDLKVKMVGLDTGSADNADSFPIHKILLATDVLIIENLTNLDQLAGKNFTVYALPLKLEVDGAPARVIANVEQ